ncbi:MAG: RluA family pseudouridine synthase [Deltaproteobacteria bacterium]|nr:RluA family pseudouridine synthase [Deltaproteobacteria bacterium]
MVTRKGPAPAPGQCDIVFRDSQVCLVDKGPGLLTVKTDVGNPPTVMGHLRHRLKGAHDQVFPVHRLDRDTSGVLVVARTRHALGTLVEELRRRDFERVYLALCSGRPPGAGTIRSHLGTVGRDLRMRTLDDGEGQLAVTHFRLVEQAGEVALVALKLETGRRNQIRVHLAELGFPLLGEQQYAAGRTDLIARQALHSHRLAITHPSTGQRVVAVSPLPEDMQRAWRVAGGKHGPVVGDGFPIPGGGGRVFELGNPGATPGP